MSGPASDRLAVWTDRHLLPPGRDLVATLAACARAGLTRVVVRELDLGRDERAHLVDRLLRSVPDLVVVTARTALPGAHGVHLAAHQETAAAGGQRFGRSCHTPGEVTDAAREGASWVTLSPFAATSSKPGYGPPVPPAAYRGHRVPVHALGGVTPDLVHAVSESGAAGVAVMGAVMRADDPAAETARLLAAIDEAAWAGPSSTGAT